MNATILDGFPAKDHFAAELLPKLQQELASAGFECRVLAPRDLKIAPCNGCFKCWVKTPGECVTDDDGRLIARTIAQSDLMVLYTPVTFGGYSSLLKRGLDRFIPNISPFFTQIKGETHHIPRYKKYPRLFALGVQEREDAEAEETFRFLVERNSRNMYDPDPTVGFLRRMEYMDANLLALHGLVQRAGGGR